MCEIFPKNLFHRNPESQALARAGFLKGIIIICRPLVWLIYKIAKFLVRLFGISLSGTSAPITQEEIIDLIETGEEEGIIKTEEREMIHSIFEFGDLKVRDVMIPRVDMVALSAKSSFKEALDKIVKTGHSRLPVYGETRDDIVGLLYAKDLLGKLGQKDFEKFSIEKLYREIEFVPEEMPVSNLFKDLKRKKTHFAIVVDEYGGTAGIVTIEDVLEELVGEIEDEFDKSHKMHRFDGDTLLVKSKLPLRDLEELTNVEIPANGADTIGGLIFQKLGRIPSEGEEIVIGNLSFKIRSIEKKRIKEIQVRKIEMDGEEEILPEVME
jgi:CBS domain containing-hemolysin-like protein